MTSSLFSRQQQTSKSSQNQSKMVHRCLNFPNASNKEFFHVNFLYQKLHRNDQVWLFHHQSEVSYLQNSPRDLGESGTVPPRCYDCHVLSKDRLQ